MLCKWPHAVGYLIPPAVDPSHVTWPSFFFSPFFFPCLPLLCSSLFHSPCFSHSLWLPLCSSSFFPPCSCFSSLSFPLYSSSSFCPPPLARSSASLFLFPRHSRFKGLISSRLPQLDLQLCCLYVLHDWERIGYYYTRSCKTRDIDWQQRTDSGLMNSLVFIILATQVICQAIHT